MANPYKSSAEEPNPKLTALPVCMCVDRRRVVVIGEGAEALTKARLACQTAAEVVVIAAAPTQALRRFAIEQGARLLRASYDVAELRGAALVFAATGDRAADRAIALDARAAGIPVNAVDQPAFCDFFMPAIVNRAPVTVAIGTEGAGPVLGQILRARIERMLPPWLGRLARLGDLFRPVVERRSRHAGWRRAYWRSFFGGAVADAFARGDAAAAVAEADRLLAGDGGQTGHVALVGAGPGAPDLLTLRAQRLLMEAEVIVHDALVPEAVIAMGRRDAERIAAGKRKGCHARSQEEINALLIRLAQAGKRVVRLKAGDPLVFGRAGEEMTALRAAGISHEIVPGVTAALAAAAEFDLPLTLRGVASSLVLTTGHDLKGAALPDWTALARAGATTAIYMGGTNASAVAARLLAAGLPPDTGVAVVENASRPEARRFHGTLADLPWLERLTDLTGPIMTLVGDAVAGGAFGHSVALAEAAGRVGRKSPEIQGAEG